MTRTTDATGRGHGIDGGGQHEQRIERETGGRLGGKSRERSAAREPGGAGCSGREPEHEKAAERKPKTPDVDLGM